MSEKKTGVITVEMDAATGELVLPLNPDLLAQMGWDDGDTLIWDELPDGSWSVKKDEQPSAVDDAATAMMESANATSS